MIEENVAVSESIPNYTAKFDNRKRILLVLIGPLISIIGVALTLIAKFVPGAVILNIPGFLMFWFGLWMPFHGVLGNSETWVIEDTTITRLRQNWLWKGKKSWSYNDIKGFRIKAVGDKGRQRPEFFAGKWLFLPEQKDILVAERLKTEIANFKRASQSVV